MQVYTSDSVVDLLSSDSTGPVCEQLTALGAQNPIHITRVLTSSLLRALADIGCVRARVNDHFLRHSALVHRRLWHVFKDLEYVTESFVCAVRVLAGRRDPKAVGGVRVLLSSHFTLACYSLRFFPFCDLK